MSCVEISILWLSISVCRPQPSPSPAPRVRSGHRSRRIAPEVEAALRHLERARERLRVQEEELGEALRIVRGK
jgi:hypothetical protein